MVRFLGPWVDLFALIGFIIMIVVAILFLQLIFVEVKGRIKQAIRKYKEKHKFDDPHPRARCQCIVCCKWHPINDRTTGYCSEYEGKVMSAEEFCSRAYEN